MLRSMTGFGESHGEANGSICSVEVRSVNNRFLKVIAKLPDRYSGLETEVERVVREQVRRGTLTVTIRLSGGKAGPTGRINRDAIQSYVAQLRDIATVDGQLIAGLLSLPGVVEETSANIDPTAEWPLFQVHVLAALKSCDNMRIDEGLAMKNELLEILRQMQDLVEKVDQVMPDTVKQYRERLVERINTLLSGTGVTVNHPDVMREVALFADRSDVSEETSRLRSHLKAFREFLDQEESAGRKLEFLGQEMFRESNTIGSKANDAAISQLVIDLKTNVERIRELIQNVE